MNNEKNGCPPRQVKFEKECVPEKILKNLYQEIYIGLDMDRRHGNTGGMDSRRRRMKKIQEAVGRQTTYDWEEECELMKEYDELHKKYGKLSKDKDTENRRKIGKRIRPIENELDEKYPGWDEE